MRLFELDQRPGVRTQVLHIFYIDNTCKDSFASSNLCRELSSEASIKTELCMLRNRRAATLHTGATPSPKYLPLARRSSARTTRPSSMPSPPSSTATRVSRPTPPPPPPPPPATRSRRTASPSPCSAHDSPHALVGLALPTMRPGAALSTSAPTSTPAPSSVVSSQTSQPSPSPPRTTPRPPASPPATNTSVPPSPAPASASLRSTPTPARGLTALSPPRTTRPCPRTSFYLTSLTTEMTPRATPYRASHSARSRLSSTRPRG